MALEREIKLNGFGDDLTPLGVRMFGLDVRGSARWGVGGGGGGGGGGIGGVTAVEATAATEATAAGAAATEATVAAGAAAASTPGTGHQQQQQQQRESDFDSFHEDSPATADDHDSGVVLAGAPLCNC